MQAFFYHLWGTFHQISLNYCGIMLGSNTQEDLGGGLDNNSVVEATHIVFEGLIWFSF